MVCYYKHKIFLMLHVICMSCAASFPYCHLTNMEVIESIKKGDRMPLPENCPDHV